MTFLVDGTLGGTFPSWTTATRPASPAVGQMGYNTTTGLFDQYTASGWSPVGATAGNVIQVVNATYSTGASNSTSTYADTGLTGTITPKFATSKILVVVHQNGVAKGPADTAVNLKLLRGSTDISQIGVFATRTASAAINDIGACSVSYLDSPATTSATIYKTQFNSYSNVASVTVQDSNVMSTITLMEIAV